MKLKEIIKDLDADAILIDNNNEEWSPDNIDADDDRDYCVDGEGVWELDEQGFRKTIAAYRFKA